MIKRIIYPAAALSLGLVGFGLRSWQMATCFDAEGLPILGAAAVGSLVLLVVAVLVALVLTLGRSWTPKPLPTLFAADKEQAFLLRLTAIPYLVVALVLLFQPDELSVPNSAVFTLANILLPKLTVTLALLAAAGLAILPSWTDIYQRGIIPLSAIPVLLCDGVLLIHFYQLHANDPMVMDFGWMTLAGIAAMVAWLSLCSIGYSEKPKIKSAVFFAFLAVVLCFASLAGIHHLFLTPFCVAQIWWFTIQLYLMANQL